MSWIMYSLMMFLGSVALYLAIRKATLERVPTHLVNLAAFAIPLFTTLGLALVRQQPLGISLVQGLVLMIVAAVFAYGGNVASLKAIAVAPNPGYSLVLSKSYVLFTTLVSVLFLHGAIDLRKAVAILLIVGFSAVVMINRTGRAAGTGNQWVWLSFASFFAWGLLSLSSKYLFSHGLGTIPFLVYLYALVSLCILVEARVGKKSLNQGIKVHWLILLAIGIFSTIFNLGQFLAINAAPNIGFVNAINASSISLVTVMSMIFFHDELTVKKSIGIAGVTAGLLLLVV